MHPAHALSLFFSFKSLTVLGVLLSLSLSFANLLNNTYMYTRKSERDTQFLHPRERYFLRVGAAAAAEQVHEKIYEGAELSPALFALQIALALYRLFVFGGDRGQRPRGCSFRGECTRLAVPFLFLILFLLLFSSVFEEKTFWGTRVLVGMSIVYARRSFGSTGEVTSTKVVLNFCFIVYRENIVGVRYNV